MASLGDIVIGLRMDASQFSGGAMQARATLASIATAAAAAGTAMMMAAAATAAYGIKLAADAEQTAIAFEVMLGSQEKAKTMLGELKAYADKSPFSGADTNEFALQLVNYGIAGEKILPTIRMLGDVAAGNKEKFSGLARAFGQMSATGRLMGQDLNQFINAGFNPLQEIAAKTGESMSSLKKRMEDGGIGSDEVAEAFKRATSEGGRFFGMTERQSQTLSGQWSTFRDNMDTTLRDIGEAISTNLDLKGILQSTGQWLGLAGGFVKTYGKEIVSLAAIMGSLVAAVALTRAAMLAYSAVQSILIMKELTLKSLMGPGAWAQVAIGLAAAAATGLYLSSVFSAAHEEARKTAESIGEIKKQTDQLAGSASGAKDTIHQLMDLQIRMKELQHVKQHSPELAASLAGKELDAANLPSLLALNELGDAAQAANPRVELLKQTLASLNDMQGLIPAQQITDLAASLNAAITREIDERSGVTKAIAQQREELAKLEMGEAAYAAAKMKAAGASEQKLAELAGIQAQTQAIKDQRKEAEQLAAEQKRQAEEVAAAEKNAQNQLAARAKQIKESTMSNWEKEKAKIAEINDLKAKGMIDEDTARTAIYNAEHEHDSKEHKGQKGNNNAALAGTSEAASILLRGAFGGNGEKVAQKTRQEQLAELKQMKTEIKLANKTKPSVLNI